MNRALGTALFSVAAAQLAKIPVGYLQTGKWRWDILGEAGGMPSSHSAGAAALATYTALKKGTSSIDFAISAIFGLIVMYDAMGIRRHAGEIAMEVNELDHKVEEIANEHPGIYHVRRKQLLEEKLGHMPLEVAGGTALGIGIGAVSFYREWRNSAFSPRRIKRFPSEVAQTARKRLGL